MPLKKLKNQKYCVERLCKIFRKKAVLEKNIEHSSVFGRMQQDRLDSN